MKTQYLFLIISAVLMAACGSGGNESVAGIDAGGGPNPTASSVVSQGTITGFGSVIVNGVHYDTNGATISVDDNPGTESDLAVGQVVTVRGTIQPSGTQGTATSVRFEDLVEGPVESIDDVASTMVVLGQSVVVTVDSVFEPGISPSSLSGLAVGQVVEVSGYLDANGDIVATYVSREDNPGEFEVTGFAANVNTGNATFEVGTLTINYATALILDFPGGAPANGQRVEAKGTVINAQGQLLATRIQHKGLDDFGDDRVELEGFVTSFTSAASFAVSGQAVATTGVTTYLNGTAADIGPNRKLEVEGEVNASGVLVATKVEFKLSGFLRIEGLVEAVQAARVTVMGVAVAVTLTTELEDNSDADIRNFALSNVNPGDYLEIRGYSDGGGFVATRVRRDDDRGESAIRGFVDSVAQPAFEILGVTVVTGPGTEFDDVSNSPISSAEFFAVAMDRLVDVNGSYSGGVLTAERVQLEN